MKRYLIIKESEVVKQFDEPEQAAKYLYGRDLSKYILAVNIFIGGRSGMLLSVPDLQEPLTKIQIVLENI